MPPVDTGLAPLPPCPSCHQARTTPGYCAACEWEMPVPDPATWSRALKAMLWERYFQDFLCAGGASRRTGWLRLLKSGFQGRWVMWRGRRVLIRWSARPADCWAVLEEQYADGGPPLAAAAALEPSTPE